MRKPVTSIALTSGAALTLAASGVGVTGAAAAGVLVDATTGGFASAVGLTTEITLVKPAPSSVPRINAVAIPPGIKRFLGTRNAGGMERSSRSVNLIRRRVSIGPGSVVRRGQAF